METHKNPIPVDVTDPPPRNRHDLTVVFRPAALPEQHRSPFAGSDQDQLAATAASSAAAAPRSFRPWAVELPEGARSGWHAVLPDGRVRLRWRGDDGRDHTRVVRPGSDGVR